MMDTGGAAINIFILKGLVSYTRQSPVTWCVALHWKRHKGIRTLDNL